MVVVCVQGRIYQGGRFREVESTVEGENPGLKGGGRCFTPDRSIHEVGVPKVRGTRGRDYRGGETRGSWSVVS